MDKPIQLRAAADAMDKHIAAKHLSASTMLGKLISISKPAKLCDYCGAALHVIDDCMLKRQADREDRKEAERRQTQLLTRPESASGEFPTPTVDPEYKPRLDAQRVTAEMKTHSTRRLDAGTTPITDSPLFGGPAQGNLFQETE